MARTKTVIKSKEDGIKKRTVVKTNKKGTTTTKESVRSKGKLLSKRKEKWKKDIGLSLKKTKGQGSKSKTTRKTKGDVYTEKTKFKTKGGKRGKVVTKEISGKKSKGTETYVLQKRKKANPDEKKATVGYYVGGGEGKRKTIAKSKTYDKSRSKMHKINR